jgi:thiamine phosphate synthase YjbQ (UPF0047 family)
MPVHHHTFTLATRGQGTYEITDEVARAVRASGIRDGTATVFVRHTSCSLIIFENISSVWYRKMRLILCTLWRERTTCPVTCGWC